MSKISMKGAFVLRLRRFAFSVFTLHHGFAQLYCNSIKYTYHHKKASRCIGRPFVLCVSDLAAKILF
jgi:hypothetical protein